MSLANISIVGNIVRTPEQMCFPSGKIKTTLTVAVNGFGKPNRGGDAADFYRVEAWGKLAELAAKYLEKGNQVAVSGRLLFDRFVDQQGKNRVVPIIEANQLSLPPKPKAINNIDEHTQANTTENIAVAAMSGHLVLESEVSEETAVSTNAEIDTDQDCADSACSAKDFKVVALEEKARARGKRQAVLSL
jgi:single-strand DNA-binding protein